MVPHRGAWLSVLLIATGQRLAAALTLQQAQRAQAGARAAAPKVLAGAQSASEGDAGPGPRPLLLARSQWGSGFDAKFSAVPRMSFRDRWLTWNADAEAIFERWWRRTQLPAEGCAARAESSGFLSARIDMEWGITSAMRDVEDQLLFGLLENKLVVFSDFVEQKDVIVDAMKQYSEQCGGTGSRAWIEECYFDNLTACTGEFRAGRMGHPEEQLGRRTFKLTSDHSWFLEKSQPLWDELVRAGAVGWRAASADSRRLNSFAALRNISLLERAELGRTESGQRQEAAERLGMFRALMLRVAFHPNAALRKAIAGIENRTGLAKASQNGPVAVVHVRRTDKVIDFLGGAQRQDERSTYAVGSGGVAASLSAMGDVLLPWLDRAIRPLSGLFLMSDDWHSYEPEATKRLARGLRNTSLKIMFNEESRTLEPTDAAQLSLGHEAWGNKAAIGLQVLAESFAAAKQADYIVGCGSSGVTQLVAQLIGGRVGMDPNVLGLWEDDHLDLLAAHQAPPSVKLTPTVSSAREVRLMQLSAE